MRPLIPLEALRVLFSVTMLGYTSWNDLKTREVSELTWVVFGALGLALDLYEVAAGRVPPLALVSAVFFSTCLSFALFYFGLFGGADFFAFIALTVLHPMPPRLIKPALGVVSVIYPLTVFSNSALAGASSALFLLAGNLLEAARGMPLFEGHETESPWRKLVVLFSGMRVRLDAVRGPPFQYPHEIPVGEEGAARRFVLMPKIMDDEEAVEVFRRLRRAGVTEVWVSHTLPFLVFIALGYLAALLLGDVALWMLRRLMAR